MDEIGVSQFIGMILPWNTSSDWKLLLIDISELIKCVQNFHQTEKKTHKLKTKNQSEPNWLKKIIKSKY